MQAYTGFAQVYDLFMDNVPYEEWGVYLTGLLQEYGVTDGIVLDLGCGTGKITRLLKARGYDMIGVDSSGEMLGAAMEQETEGILYLCQDMRKFELYGTVAAVVSICDSINYILEEDELREVFALVNNYLDPGGMFVFDLNTRYKYETVLGDTVICENREEGSFIWENYYHETEQVNEYDLTFFVREEGELYRKYQETHYQRGYDLGDVKRLLQEAGLEFVAAYDAFTREAPRQDSQRIYIIAREFQKRGIKQA
ncbi:MAG: class I SAM-dependent methyltransferase [Lachnospiraceae bacterium]|nr:class I SAM-dependent methyltransferase [Lachnospiraceae bacterium]